MERADISLNKGIHRSPNYSRDKGELSECVNIMPVQGELKNMPKATNVKAEYNGSDINVKMPTGHTLAAIHKMQTGKRYLSLAHAVGVKANDMYHYYTQTTPATNPYYWVIVFEYALDVDIQLLVNYKHGDDYLSVTGTIPAGQNIYDLSTLSDFSVIDFANDTAGYSAEYPFFMVVVDFNNSEYTFYHTYNTISYQPADWIKSTTPLNINSLWTAAEGDVDANGILNFTQIENSDKEGDDERKFSTIGNTLIEYGEGGTNYYLWEGESYTNLGSQLPSLNVRPYLKTRLMDNTQMNTTFGANMDAIASPALVGDGLLSTTDAKNLYDYKAWIDAHKAWELDPQGSEPVRPANSTTEKYLYGSQRENIASRIFAMLNQYVEIISREGLFYAPFFVRFAYRMYDGSHVMHTPPVLLAPNTIGKPVMRVILPNNSSANLNPIFMTSSLFAEIFVPDDIEKWYDIITHVDIYITPQIIDYTDSSESIISICFNDEYEGTVDDVIYYNDDKYDVTGRYMTSVDVTSGGVQRKMLKTHDNDDYEVEYAFLGNGSVQSGKSYAFRRNKSYKENYLLFKTNSPSFQVYNSAGLPITKLPAIPPELEALLPPVLANNYTAYIIGSGGITGTVSVSSNVDYYWYVGPVSENNQAIAFTIKMQRADNAGLEKLVAEESSFHLVSSIEIDKVNETLGAVEIKEGVLNTVDTREALPEIGQGRRSYIFDEGISYNNRMNLVVQKETLPSTDTLENIIADCKWTGAATLQAYVMCKENGQTVYTQIHCGVIHAGDSVIYFAYPSATAVKLLVKATLSSPSRTEYHSIPLRAHSILDLAQAFDGFNDILLIGNGVTENISNPSQAQKEFEAAEAGETYVEYGNKIVVSNPDNPFVFREDLFKTLQGNILAIATTSKPLSEGQFGQFPLYAFCDDGVWALEVNNDGTYQAPQIVSGEVCNNKKTVTQLDDGVSFTTDGGLLLLTGREIAKISGVLDGYNINDSAILSGLTQEQLAGWYSMLDSDTSEFASWCSQATYTFDGVNKLIRIYCAGKRQMVYSLESGEFAEQIDGFAISQNMKVINDYPYIIVQDGQNLYTYRKMLDDGIDKLGFALTRIINAEGADTYTAIMQAKTFLNSVREYSALHTIYGWGGNSGAVIYKVYTDSTTPAVGDVVFNQDRKRIGMVSAFASNLNQITLDVDTTHTSVNCIRDQWIDVVKQPSVKIVILGSNDMSTWIPLSSLKGQSFKHFRVALFSDMYDNDSLSGLTLLYETRRTNKLR